MKKKFLFILILFIVLVGTYKDEIQAANNPDVAKALIAIEEAPPVITEVVPKAGRVKGFAKQNISFYADFKANPCDSVRVYKEGKKITKGVTVTKTRAMVALEDATTEDAGEYKIVVKNKLGTAEATFTVTVVADKK